MEDKNREREREREKTIGFRMQVRFSTVQPVGAAALDRWTGVQCAEL